MEKCPYCKNLLEEVPYIVSERTFKICNTCDIAWNITGDKI